MIELFCRCDREVAAARYRARAGTRHAGHFDEIRSADEIWNEEVDRPVAGGWPVVEVDTDRPVDLPALVDTVRHLTAG